MDAQTLAFLSDAVASLGGAFAGAACAFGFERWQKHREQRAANIAAVRVMLFALKTQRDCLLEVDSQLLAPLKAAGVNTHLIGGAQEAGELDAKRAIDQGTRLGARL